MDFQSFRLVASVVVQVLLLTTLVYYVLSFFRHTRGFQSLIGGVIVVIALVLLTQFFEMNEIWWLMGKVLPLIPLILIILFQPELRSLFAGVVEKPVAKSILSMKDVDELCKCVTSLSKSRIGAIIAIECSTSLLFHEVAGRKLNIPIISEVLSSIFIPGGLLHDGGVIIRNGTIAAAGCVFPLAQSQSVHRAYGTRHRAAIGLTENSDALVIVVSEETGLISVADHGFLERGLTDERLRAILTERFVKAKPEDESSGGQHKSWISSLWRKSGISGKDASAAKEA